MNPKHWFRAEPESSSDSTLLLFVYAWSVSKILEEEQYSFNYQWTCLLNRPGSVITVQLLYVCWIYIEYFPRVFHVVWSINGSLCHFYGLLNNFRCTGESNGRGDLKSKYRESMILIKLNFMRSINYFRCSWWSEEGGEVLKYAKTRGALGQYGEIGERWELVPQ